MVRKITIFLIISALMASLTIAGTIYPLNDFKEEPVQAIVLEEGDAIEFNLLNATHIARIKSISQSNNTIKLRIYPFKGFATEAPMGLNNVVYVDLDRDKKDDVVFDVYKIEDRKVTLIIKSLEQQEQNESGTETTPPTGQGLVKGSVEKNHYRTFFVIGVIIVALLGVLALMKHKKRHIEEEKPKHEHKHH